MADNDEGFSPYRNFKETGKDQEVQPDIGALNDELRKQGLGSMTHQTPAQAQPAMPPATPDIVSAIGNFFRGGLAGAGAPMPDWMAHNPVQSALQNPDNQAALEALTLKRAFGWGNDRGYHLMDEGGNKVGEMSAQYKPWKNELYIPGMNSTAGPNSLGSENVRSIVKALRGEFPQAKRITAIRSSGARHGPAAASGTDWPLAHLDLD